MNVVALLSCLLCGLGAYVLGRRLGLSTGAALLCGVIFAFSPARFFRITQLHLTTVQWIPFALASLHAYVDNGDRRHLWLAMAFVSLQALSSGHGGAFIALAVTLFIAWRVVLGGPAVLKTLIQDLGVRGVLLLVPSLLILGIAVLASFGFERLASYVVPRRKTLAAAIIGALMLVEFAAMPLRAVRYRLRIPAADRWLDSQPKPFVVAEVPVFPSERYQTMYMLHSMGRRPCTDTAGRGHVSMTKCTRRCAAFPMT